MTSRKADPPLGLERQNHQTISLEEEVEKPPTQAEKDARKALSIGNADAIIDIKVTANENQDAEMSRAGYTQLLQEAYDPRSKSLTTVGASTFGNKASLWTWRRSGGTCSGRLKPIVDIQLARNPESTNLVLSGYTCDPTPINGQWLWIKRAASDDEEMDAVVDLYVTTGKMKNTSDPIWSSPGVGWIRVDGNFSKTGVFTSSDALLWFHPFRSRSVEKQMASPIRAVVALTEEERQTRLLYAVRVALRHHVEAADVKRLANITIMDAVSGAGETADRQASIVRSERLLDFTAMFHKFNNKGKLTLVKFGKLLNNAGVRMSTADTAICFNYFDVYQKGVISPEEYAAMLSLTDFELDLAVEKVRLKLISAVLPTNNGPKLKATISKRTSGVIHAGSLEVGISTGKYKIRQNLMLIEIFRIVDNQKNGIISVDELMDLSSKLEVFLTEEEARRFLVQMDISRNDRVEEFDFIYSMNSDNDCIPRKASRVRDSAAALRRWLVRGSSDTSVGPGGATASNQQWHDFKINYERVTKMKFPGFLSSQLMSLTTARLGIRLSAMEARELTLLIAPEKNGRIFQSDLHAFMTSSCRTIGELIALVEKDIFSDLLDAYRAHREALEAEGKEDIDLSDFYRKRLLEFQSEIENVYAKQKAAEAEAKESDGNGDTDGVKSGYKPEKARPQFRSSGHEIIALSHLKAGIEEYILSRKIYVSGLPNLEEWACLACTVDAAAADGDIYGVRLASFIEGICDYTYRARIAANERAGIKKALDKVAIDLRRTIYNESKALGKKGKPDYKAVFVMLDTNGNGVISTEEFRAFLLKLQLISHLPENLIPALLAMFDKGRRGCITLTDFIAFAEAAKDEDEYYYYDEEPENAMDEFDFDEDYADGEMTSQSSPPATITRNPECDWLLWFLYRQACKVEPLDPESVVNEMESICGETAVSADQSYISVRELWNVLFELKLQGSMSKLQYSQGIQLLCRDGHGRDNDLVDFEALGKYIVRMGRAYNASMQERLKQDREKFAPLAEILRSHFQQLLDERVADKNGRLPVPHYERLFKRIDVDGDGMLTVKEFKIGLQKLRYKDEKAWNPRLIRLLFDECDKNRDGLLSIKEFTAFVTGSNVSSEEPAERILNRNDRSFSNRQGRFMDSSTKPPTTDQLNLSDDEEDDVFRKHRSTTDHELIRKVNDVLHDIVPYDGASKESHTDLVRDSVRRFFQRADPEYTGTVSEERFRAFLRRSSIQDRLKASEIRRLTEKLKKRGYGKNKAENLIDYEKLCQLLTVAMDSVPLSKAETVFVRFQDAANASAMAGRPFLSLCSLVDLKLTGYLSKDEFLHTAKMMDCPMTHHDLNALMEMLPSSAIGREGVSIDYRTLNNMIDSYVPNLNRSGARYDLDHRLNPYTGLGSTRFSGALPSYASPGGTTHLGLTSPYKSTEKSMINRSISTPLGLTVSTPYGFEVDPTGSTAGIAAFSRTAPQLQRGGDLGTGAYDKLIYALAERVRAAIDEKSKVWGNNYSIRQHFETFDAENIGALTIRNFQLALDDIGVPMSASDLHALQSLYGRPNDTGIYYDSFCRTVDNFAMNIPPRSFTQSAPGLPLGRESSTGSNVSYLGPRVMQRYRELRNEGRNPKDLMEIQDLDRTGMIHVSKFREAVYSTGLLQTEFQMSKAIDDFSSISNRAYILYDEFCSCLEKASRLERSAPQSLRQSGYVNGNGFDGLAKTSNSRNNYYEYENESYGDNSPVRPRSSSWNTNTLRGGYPIELEDGSVGSQPFGALSPPKITDSINALTLNLARRPGSPGGSRYRNQVSSSWDRFSDNGHYDSITGDLFGSSAKRGIAAPRTSPSKVGSKMWGSDTPLAKKGNPLRTEDDKWCCAVCLYVENSSAQSTCAVCDSPNYAKRKDYAIKEQCVNCTFLNGQFAEECEMCGEPLSHNQKFSATKKSDFSTPTSYGRY